MKEIKLTRGLVTIVDDDVFEELNKYKWYAQKTKNTFYAQRCLPFYKKERKMCFMHHEIIGKPEEKMKTDHIDGNGLNNLRSNLRHVTHRQNLQNMVHGQKKTSSYIGVCRDKSSKKWLAQIAVNGVNKKIGYFDQEIDAYHAYLERLTGMGETMVGEI